MATVTLTRDECANDLLPNVCMFCGQPATIRRQKTFSWHPSWVWVFVLVGLLIAMILALALTKRMNCRVPVCNEHEGFWRRRTIALGASFMGITVLAFGGFAIASNLGPGNADATGWACFGGALMFFAWLVLAAVYSSRGVRPIEITDDKLRLAGVSSTFADELEVDRARDDEEYRRRRERRRAVDAEEQLRLDYDVELPSHRRHDDLDRRAGE